MDRGGWLLLFLFVFLLLSYKSPDALSNPQFWAEDGTIFFSEQFGRALPQLFTSYAGYLHTIPRLVAWLASAFPYGDQPEVYNFCAIAIDSAAVLFFALRSRWLVPAWLTLLVFALVPTDGEMFGTLTNVQWFLQFALFAAALYPSSPHRSSFARRWLGWAIIALVALTGPFSILLTVITISTFLVTRAGQRLAPRRLHPIQSWWSKLDKPTLGIIAMCALAQGFVLTFIGSRSTSPFDPVLGGQIVLLGFQIHTFGNTLFSEKVSAAVFALVLIACFKVTCRTEQPILLVMLAMLVFGVAQILSAAHPVADTPKLYTDLMGDRYFLFAKVSFWICTASALSCSRGVGKSTARALVPMLLVLIAICHPGMMRRPPFPDLHWKQAVKMLGHQRTPAPVTIPINPIPWEIKVTPSRIR